MKTYKTIIKDDIEYQYRVYGHRGGRSVEVTKGLHKPKAIENLSFWGFDEVGIVGDIIENNFILLNS